MSAEQTILKRTPLFESHKKLGAKLVPFAGWEMPVLYAGLIPEHNATRTSAGLFDVSHMGEIRVRGKDAERAINFVSCNDIRKIQDGQAQYGAVLNKQGGVVDDIIVYRVSAEDYLICVNASNTDRVFEWMSSNHGTSATFTNESSQWGQIAIQGPKAVFLAEQFLDKQLVATKYFRFVNVEWQGTTLMTARTGYTGEDGFEFFVPAAKTEALWEGLLTFSNEIVPCGLGARDTLRLEACLPLHGHELSEEWTAQQAGLDRFIALEKGDFIGRDALLKEKESGLTRKLCGFILQEPGIARQADKVFPSQDSSEVGFVTSGTKTPTVNKALGLALVEKKMTEPGTKFFVEIRGKKVAAEVVSTPFYRRAK